MRDYSKGKIYKIVCNETGNTYYGSTINDRLCQTLRRHKKDYKNWKKGKRGNVTSFQIIEIGDYDIILVENFPCGSKDELKSRERFYIENYTCVNKQVPNKTNKEWKIENKDKVNEYKKTFYEQNPYYLKNYRENNRDKIKELIKNYYENNKEKIQTRNKEKLVCECGSKVSRIHMKRHTQSKKHLDFVENK